MKPSTILYTISTIKKPLVNVYKSHQENGINPIREEIWVNQIEFTSHSALTQNEKQ